MAGTPSDPTDAGATAGAFRWMATDAAGVAAAAEAMRAGGVVLVPTESSYALGADPRSAGALARVRRLKRRDPARPLLLLCADVVQAKALVAMDERAERLAAAWPAPLTLLLAPRPEMLALARALGGESLAVRVPAHPAARALAAALGHPFTGTSANLAGEPPALDPSEAVSLGAPLAVLDAGRLPGGLASTVVDLTGPAMRIVREGAMPAAVVERLLLSAR